MSSSQNDVPTSLFDLAGGDYEAVARAGGDKEVGMAAAQPGAILDIGATYSWTGGVEFALSADLIVAAASARFADTHGKWGLVSGWGLSHRPPRRIAPPAPGSLLSD